jgi:hypothetical protein
MLRPLLAVGFAALVAAPAAAATYSAVPEAPVGVSRIVARDVLWTCGAGGCTGATPNGRPLIVCQSLAKKTGRIERFLVDGRELPGPELERCNASAEAPPSADPAAQ